MAWFLLASRVSAQSYRIEEYDVHMTVQADGVVQVTEKLTCVLDGRVNGGTRDILHASVSDVRVTEEHPEDGAIEYTTGGWNQSTVPRHGFVVEGGRATRIFWRSRAADAPPHENHRTRFTLRYRIDHALKRYWSGDVLYWKVIPSAREFPLSRGRCQIDFPSATADFEVAFHCTVADASWTKRGRSIVFAASPVPAGEEFEVRIAMPKGVLTGPTTLADLMGGGLGVFVLIGGLLAVVLFTFWRWQRCGRDPQPSRIHGAAEDPELAPPAHVACVLDLGATHRGITATLLDLGRRGYLHIEQQPGDESVFRFRLERDDTEGLTRSEDLALGVLFDQDRKACSVTSSDALPAGAIKRAEQTLRQIEVEAVERGYLAATPTAVVRRNALGGLGLLALGLVLVAYSDPTAAFMIPFGAVFGGLPLLALLGIWRRTGKVAAFLASGCIQVPFILAFSLIGVAVMLFGFVLAYTGPTPISHIPGLIAIALGVATLATSRAMIRVTQTGADLAQGWRDWRVRTERDAEHLESRSDRPESGALLAYAVALGFEDAYGLRFPTADVGGHGFPLFLTRDRHTASEQSDDSLGTAFGVNLTAMTDSLSAAFSPAPESSGWSGGGSTDGGGGGGGGGGGAGGW